MMLTITPEVRHALLELSVITGVSSASFASQMLQDAIPMFVSMTEAFKQAKLNKSTAFDEVSDMLIQAQHKISSTQLELLDSKKVLTRRKTPQKKKSAKKKTT